MPTLPIVFHPDYAISLRRGHQFPMSKYGYVRDMLLARGLIERGRFLSPAPAPRRAVELAHDPAYVDRLFALDLTDREVRRIGLPLTDTLIRRARLSAAGTILAAWLALEHGIACNAAGGSHHAGPDYGAGFCILNDVAIAVCGLRAQGIHGPFLIVDLDVHQGDGTARIFQDDPEVLTLSIHSEKNFPARKACSDFDIGLPDGTDDQGYLDVLEDTLRHVLARVSPRIVFYNAGVDVHRLDKLGRLSLTDAGLRQREALVISRIRQCGASLVGVLGGGYSDDPTELADRHLILFEEAQRQLWADA